MKRNLSFPGWMFAVIFSTCLAMSGCLSAPIDIVQGIADATFSVAKTAVDVPLDVAGAVVDIPHTNYKINLTEEREWTFDRGNAKQTDVEACNGSIVVSGTDRDQVVVHAWKKVYARTRADVDKFMAKIDLFAQSEGDRIHAGFHYPPDRRHLSFSIHYEIQVPQAMDLKLTTDNARIQVHHVNGRITARTSNGGIEVADGKYDADLNTSNSAVELNNVEGGFHVETSNAAIRVKQGKGHFTFNTSNGSIELDDSSGRFHARTSNASMREKVILKPITPPFRSRRATVSLPLPSRPPTVPSVWRCRGIFAARWKRSRVTATSNRNFPSASAKPAPVKWSAPSGTAEKPKST